MYSLEKWSVFDIFSSVHCLYLIIDEGLGTSQETPAYSCIKPRQERVIVTGIPVSRNARYDQYKSRPRTVPSSQAQLLEMAGNKMVLFIRGPPGHFLCGSNLTSSATPSGHPPAPRPLRRHLASSADNRPTVQFIVLSGLGSLRLQPQPTWPRMIAY